ncbi:hypothetical protein [Secundilactobacillus silagei]|uniref:Uncharacterized protein n=1 Tax=Secundilactobacillus silagei JCM 19001 TaxID=1302250 RepID=A0A1Z5IH84_9LACO|nr:hypothetical protein [Secundilactobacillus silagei]TDG69275.1 hypothetical protein C5L25_000206 [Secundilactobacillus silagei JCM 19001]GAX00998.1 hypothetical protein IWT126_01020 [Secundilactobacillus silagei JCM 19001]
MNVINFSGHPVVQRALVKQFDQQAKLVDAETMTRFRSLVRADTELFGEQSSTREQTDI